MYQNLFDSHSHSENSPDGHHSVTFMVETAMNKGFHGLAITDHCECGVPEDRYDLRLRQAALDVAVAKAAFRNRIILTTGVEMGQPQLDPTYAWRILSSQRFDFVLLSVHRVTGYPPFSKIDYTEYSADMLHKLLLQYFEELLSLATGFDYDVLAHLSFPLRHPRQDTGIEIDLTRYAEPIDAILRAMVAGGKGLELNTAGLFREMASTLPPAWVVRRFRELGGELVTIGSDAHRAWDIGRGVADGMQILADAGFDHFAFYRDRRPVMLRII